jgi:hypothetical protein
MCLVQWYRVKHTDTNWKISSDQTLEVLVLAHRESLKWLLLFLPTGRDLLELVLLLETYEY